MTGHRPSTEGIRPSSSRPALSVPALCWAFLRIGATAFGGLGAAVALLQRELVDQRQWLAPSDLTDALAYTKPLPGSTVVQVVTFVGWRLRGIVGACCATLAFLLPSAALMIAAAAASAALPRTPWVAGALTGIQVAVAGLLGAAFWRLARSEARSRSLVAVLVAAAALGFVANAAVLVVAAGLVGVMLDRVPPVPPPATVAGGTAPGATTPPTLAPPRV